MTASGEAGRSWIWNIKRRLEPIDYGEYADSNDELPLGEQDQAHGRISG
jgi:hypothetical protein